MKIHAPTPLHIRSITDIHGERIDFGMGRRTLVSLFREATCPFCNFRVFELTHNYPGLSALGLDIVAVFYSGPEDVKKFNARQPRPFRMVTDAEGELHRQFGVGRSMIGKLRAMMLRWKAMFIGMRETELRGMLTGNLLQADFLIDETGTVVETFYGRDVGDHIPMERIELFAARGMASRATNS